ISTVIAVPSAPPSGAVTVPANCLKPPLCEPSGLVPTNSIFDAGAILYSAAAAEEASAAATATVHNFVIGPLHCVGVRVAVAAGRAILPPAGSVRHVAFREESRLFSYGRHYYQQRYNFVEPQDDLTLGDFLRAGTSAGDADVRAAADRLGVGGLLGLSFLKL